MDIRTVFKKYEDVVTRKAGSEKIFSSSGMVNTSGTLNFGFFPLGSGILSDSKSQINKASIDEGGIMVLGNDFGTVTYLDSKCKGNRESGGSKTISNLLRLGLNPESTFFTNFYLGLRDDETHKGTTMTKRIKKLEQDYKDLCYGFFRIQLEMINAKTVICLGKDVGHTLSEYSDLFQSFSKKHGTITNLYADNSKENYIIKTDDGLFGRREFILIPHPSFAHINWKKNDIENKIRKAINK